MLNLRYRVKRVLSRFGLELRRVPTLNGAQPSWLTHPVTADYLPDYRGSLVVGIRIADARGLHVLGLPFDDAHPFVQAARAGLAARNDGDTAASVRTVLADRYAAFQPATALEAVSLTEIEAPGLIGQPAYACLLPWSARTISETVRGRAIAMREAGLQYGTPVSLDDGLTSFGPATSAKLDLETRRISGLLQSVKKHGFRPFDPQAPLKACALLSGDILRWQIEEGHHRIPVAVASGIKTVPVMVTQIIRKDDAAHWPRVADGTFTAQGAARLFDRIFNA